MPSRLWPYCKNCGSALEGEGSTLHCRQCDLDITSTTQVIFSDKPYKSSSDKPTINKDLYSEIPMSVVKVTGVLFIIIMVIVFIVVLALTSDVHTGGGFGY